VHDGTATAGLLAYPTGTQPAIPSGPLCRVVAEMCAELRPYLSQPSATRLDYVGRRLAGPLQLAVAGRIKSGKSTVVNALIGRRVAPTDVRECTRLVTRFQYGTVDRVEVVRTDGSRHTLPYDADGLVPMDLGAELDSIAYVDAYLTSALLESVTVIDTPGLGSTDQASVRRTTVLLGGPAGNDPSAHELDANSQAAVAQAEAVLYVLTQAARADDAEALAIFRAYATPQASSPVNAVGLLNKADQVTGNDPIAAATALAAAQARALRHRVSDVLPLVGLMAEATETGHFTEGDADVLRQIARLEPASLELLFFSADLFVRPEMPISVSGRARLLERLDLFGIRQAVDLIASTPGLTTGDLRRRLVEQSGFPVLRELIEHAFRRRADGIKASVALAALEVIAAQAPTALDRSRIRDAVEGLLQRPEAHQLRLLEAAALVSSGTVPMPDELAAELAALIGGESPAEQLNAVGADLDTMRRVALERAAAWRSFATFGSSPAQSRVAHVVHRGFFLLWQQLNAGATR
jgi:Dynamin family